MVTLFETSFDVEFDELSEADEKFMKIGLLHET